jgi:hypothetical protein
MANLSNKIPPLGVAVNESPTFTGGITVTGTVAATDFTGDGTTLTGVATITGTETLTNKTLDTPAVTGSITQQSADLGALLNDSTQHLSLRSDTANDDQLVFTTERLSAGATWATAAHRIQRTVGGGKYGYIQFGDSPEFISFGQGTVEYTRINNAGAFLHGQPTDGVAGWGDIVVSGGLYVGAANAANYLDDYEEGTWTPSIAFGGASVGVAYGTQVGRYTKIGNLVTAISYIVLTSKGTSTGAVAIDGLPFTSENVANLNSAATLRVVNISFADFIMAFQLVNTTTVLFEEITNAGVKTDITNANFSNTSNVMMTVTYRTA